LIWHAVCWVDSVGWCGLGKEFVCSQLEEAYYFVHCILVEGYQIVEEGAHRFATSAPEHKVAACVFVDTCHVDEGRDVVAAST